VLLKESGIRQPSIRLAHINSKNEGEDLMVLSQRQCLAMFVVDQVKIRKCSPEIAVLCAQVYPPRMRRYAPLGYIVSVLSFVFRFVLPLVFFSRFLFVFLLVFPLGFFFIFLVVVGQEQWE
jgi:hypothetical protein